MIRLRAIETGRAVLRPAWAGVSALVLPSGEVAPGALPLGPVDPELSPSPEEPAGLLVAEAPLLRGTTLYTRFGDLFAWACAALAAAALGTAVLAGRPRAGALRPPADLRPVQHLQAARKRLLAPGPPQERRLHCRG